MARGLLNGGNGATGISWRELAIIGPFIGVTIIGALQIGGVEKQVSVNTDRINIHDNDIKAIVQHDADTTASFKSVQRQLDELRATELVIQSRISALRLEYLAQPQFAEYKEGVHSEITSRYRLLDLMQKEIEDINKQIAAAVATQNPFKPTPTK